MNFKSIKFFSLLAGLVMAAQGAAVKAESIAPDSLLDEQNSAIAANLITSELSLPIKPTSGVTAPVTADDAETSLISTSTDKAYTRLQNLLAANEPVITENVTESASATSSPNSESLTFSAKKVASLSEEAILQAEGDRLSEAARTRSSVFPRDPYLIGDSGAPDFGEAIYWSPSRPDSHAPISVMGDHTHGKGEFMLSYRYMYMDMDGNRSGTDSLSTAEVLQEFPVTPVRMTMEMHMLGAMYAPTDNLTLMTMLPYITKDMDHETRMGGEFTTRSEGIGDVRFGGLYKVLDRDRQRIHLNLSLSAPTGSIEERDATPMGPDQILPYPMQIGSGTYDLHPGVTYLGQAGRWSWGSQATGTIRLGENSNGYRKSNEFTLTGWGARSWTDWFSTSLRLGGKTWGDYGGADDRLNPNMIPTADPDRRAGSQLDLGLGLNFYVPEGTLSGSRFALEFNLPVYRSLSGPQLETDFSATAGLQTVF